ncbi:MAG: hypothetical protein FIB02_07435 [Desulfuromonas sp.]|nr:hypothetical protein [Desulfuromonas sp.]
MKGLAITLAGLIMVLGVGILPATAGPGDQEPLLDNHRNEATLVFHTNSDTGSDEMDICQTATVLGYALSPKVTIDLQNRFFPSTENSPEFVGERIAVDRITQNLLLGFSYKF